MFGSIMAGLVLAAAGQGLPVPKTAYVVEVTFDDDGAGSLLFDTLPAANFGCTKTVMPAIQKLRTVCRTLVQAKSGQRGVQTMRLSLRYVRGASAGASPPGFAITGAAWGGVCAGTQGAACTVPLGPLPATISITPPAS